MARNIAAPGRTAAALVLGITTLACVGIAAPAAAAAPSNDDRGAATVIGSVPFNDTVDTTDATSQASDPNACDFSGEGDATVWYSFTPTRAGRYMARTAGSDYDTTLTLAVPTGGGLATRDCSDDDGWGSDSMIVWDAEARQEYLLMVGGCCPGSRGHLEFSVVAPPPPPTVRLWLGANARLTRLGAVVLHGRLECRRVPTGRVSVSVRQDQGLRIVRGGRGERVHCGDRWTLKVSNWDYRFNDSDISVVARARVSNLSGGASRTVRRSVDVD
jgi:hypothetical protein